MLSPCSHSAPFALHCTDCIGDSARENATMREALRTIEDSLGGVTGLAHRCERPCSGCAIDFALLSARNALASLGAKT